MCVIRYLLVQIQIVRPRTHERPYVIDRIRIRSCLGHVRSWRPKACIFIFINECENGEDSSTTYFVHASQLCMINVPLQLIYEQ
jgi:hypothetical protein